MPECIFELRIWLTVISQIFFSTLVAYIMKWLFRQSSENQSLTILVTFSLLGMTLGYISSKSREPVISVLIPAFVTFLGGFTVYLICKDMKKGVIIGKCLLSLMISLSFGLEFGASARYSWELYQQEQLKVSDNWNKQLDKQIQLAKFEKKINDYRASLKLKPLSSLELFPAFSK